MVMLHIKFKGITKCSSMVANILPADPSLTLGMRSIVKKSTFSEHGRVAYQIEGNHQMQHHHRVASTPELGSNLIDCQHRHGT